MKKFPKYRVVESARNGKFYPEYRRLWFFYTNFKINPGGTLLEAFHDRENAIAFISSYQKQPIQKKAKDKVVYP